LKNNQRKFIAHLLLGILAVSATGRLWGETTSLSTADGGLSVRVDADSGAYEIAEKDPSWHFGGNIGRSLTGLNTSSGKDANGAYHQISFAWTFGTSPMSGSIRLYDDSPVAVFSETSQNAMELPPAPFPSFRFLPPALHIFSYRQSTFAPPQFRASDGSTPWLFFDDSANAVIISPASHFMVASMSGDGRRQITSGLNSSLRDLPAGFTQQTIMTFGQGINHTWDLWGDSLRGLQDIKRPDNQADTVLKYFGYWTDNGAYYYYNYDTNEGYAGTLEALAKYYREEHIPIRYMQLDSWWYYKTFTDANGSKGTTKQPRLPEGEWNRYGGLLEYKAHPALFPKGMAAFQKDIGLPLVTHNRWIDPESPYHEHYQISGIAAVDPKWWHDIAHYLQKNGVITYEQDWLDRIYRYSPAFSSNVDTAEDFLGDMSRASAKQGMTLQYCMPYPGYYLQGSEYENLTTIRTSDDRFCPPRYNNFLYDSRLAYSMGIWPWSDVFFSPETNNMLLSTLSAGPVGTGDKIGEEDTNNIFKAVRADGVIVKPDVPALPLDQCYITDTHGQPGTLLASTYTDHDGNKTAYVFAFNRSKSQASAFHFTPGELGFTNPVCVFDYFGGTGRRLDATETFSGNLEANATALYIVAPFGQSSIAFLGDEGKFVSTGKQRIASLKDETGKLTVDVLFAPTENSVVLHGYAAHVPQVSARSGEAKVVNSVPDTGYFEVEVRPDLKHSPKKIDGDPARRVTVTLAVN
jgi:hypothetical protein